MKRLSQSIEQKKSEQSKRAIPAQVLKKKSKKAKKSNKSTKESSRCTLTDDSVSNQDISDLEPAESETDSNNNVTSPTPSLKKSILVSDYIIVCYDSEFYPAEVTAIVDKKYKCNCMMSSKSGWKWPEKRDKIWYDVADVIKKIGQLMPVTSCGTYKFADF